MSGFYFNLKKGKKSKDSRIVTIDTEWAKNWKAKEKIVPFCTCIHSIYLQDIDERIDIDKFSMESELYFRSKSESTQDYVSRIDSMFSKYIDDRTTIVGHQISSDLHTLIQCSKTRLETVERIIDVFRERKNKGSAKGFRVADTRYDINARVTGNGAEKLRSVSLRLKIFAIQNELNEMSLTKMYNQYVVDDDREKREKLQVLNWRHAFQTGLVWLADSNNGKDLYNAKFNGRFLVTNDILFEMGKASFKYLCSAEHDHGRTIEGISKYINKYDPKIRLSSLLRKD